MLSVAPPPTDKKEICSTNIQCILLALCVCGSSSLFSSYYYSHPLRSPHGCTEPRPAGVVKGVFAQRHAMSSCAAAMRREKTFCYIAKVPLLWGRQVQKDIRPPASRCNMAMFSQPTSKASARNTHSALQFHYRQQL